MDLTIFETGNGGDVVKTTNDLQTNEALFNQVYLAWFGGNLDDEVEYWQTETESNGNLETVLNRVALTPQGLYELQNQAKDDLKFIDDDVEIDIEVTGLDRLSITAIINQLNITFVWDATKSEVIESRFI